MRATPETNRKDSNPNTGDGRNDENQRSGEISSMRGILGRKCFQRINAPDRDHQSGKTAKQSRVKYFRQAIV